MWCLLCDRLCLKSQPCSLSLSPTSPFVQLTPGAHSENILDDSLLDDDTDEKSSESKSWKGQ